MKNKTNHTSVFTRSIAVLLVCGCLGIGVALAGDLVVFKDGSVRVPVGSGIKKITVANPAVIDARPSDDGTSVVISGLSEGTSELRIERLSGADLVTNAVVRADLTQMLAEIKELLGDVEGLETKILGSKIVMKGNILTKSDFDKVSKVVEAYNSVILNMSTFDRSEMNKYVEQAILKDIGLDTVTARVSGDQVILEGVTYSEADLARAMEMAKLRAPNVKSLLKVEEVMIETDVQFVQVSTDASKDMGFNVLDSLDVGGTAGLTGTGRGGQLPLNFGVSATAQLKIKALLGNGSGKIVAQPHLSTKSGDVGLFQSGGTKYFAVPSSVGPSSLQSVDYGVILKVKPVLQGRDRIQNVVTVEVSLPVPDATGVLTLQKYETTCTAVCKVGESMVMSGMVQTLSAKNGSKTPLLGDIPLVDLFFSSKTSSKTKNEFVIVVTPQPVFPTAAAGKPLGEQHQKLLQEKDAEK